MKTSLTNIFRVMAPVFATLFSLQAVSTPHNFQIDISQAEVKEIDFLAVGKPSALKVRGKGEALSGNISFVNGKITGVLNLDLKSLKTGIDLRDNHMKEKYLEVEKFADAKLKIQELAIKEIPAGKFSQNAIPFAGELTLHGMTKPVQGTLNLTQDLTTISVEAQFSIKIEDFSIPVPNYMGITIANEIQVGAHFKAQMSELK